MLRSSIKSISLLLVAALACLAPTGTFTISVVTDNMFVDGVGVGWRPQVYTSCSERNGSTHHVWLQGYFQTGSYYYITQGFLRFDTSSIPDNAIVTNARLRLYVLNVNDVSDTVITGEWYSAGNWPISCKEDYTPNWSATAFSKNAWELSVGSYNTIQLLNVGSINKAGLTGLRLHIVPNNTPGSFPGKFVVFAAYNLSQTPPVLEVDYFVPGLQTVVIDGD